jgi:hypothetical protein
MDHDPSTIKTQEDFAAFVRALADWRWKGTPDGSPLNRYFTTLASYVDNLDTAELYTRLGRPEPEEPSWELFGQLLYAAGMYFEL